MIIRCCGANWDSRLEICPQCESPFTERDAIGWAQDCGMAYSASGSTITVDRDCLDQLVRERDILKKNS